MPWSNPMRVAARDSPLSRAQVEELLSQLRQFHPHCQFEVSYLLSRGDRDRHTSLRTLEKSDFFTREIDDLLLSRAVRIAIHSAKDLPDPLRSGLQLVAITRGLDPSDALVFRKPLGESPTIATSSTRREEAVKELFPHAQFVDLRGTIAERLAKLDDGTADGVVVAEAALIRLQLTHLPRLKLPGDTPLLQGKLAIVACRDDLELRDLFTCLHDHEAHPLPRP